MKPGQSPQDEVIAANIEFYKRTTTGEYDYDRYEYCVSDRFIQRMVEKDLEVIASGLSGKSRQIHCLDCGGGSGNLTLKMLRRGWDVTVVDVSPDMLAAADSKLKAVGYKPKLVNDSIENFLTTSRDVFDVVTFSSVLHHLYDPLSVIRTVATRIAPGGFFYSNFDMPRPSNRFVTALFLDFDTFFAKFLVDKRDFLPGIFRRLRKLFTAINSVHGRPVITPGDLAEYHAKGGLDDKLIVSSLRDLNFVVDHQHYRVARTSIARTLNIIFPVLLNFRIIAQKRS